MVDGLDTKQVSKDDLGGIRALAQELAAEVWFTIQDDKERTHGLPKELESVESLISVILVLEPEGDEVTLRVVKDHENEDLQDLHVGLDPRTLLLVRS